MTLHTVSQQTKVPTSICIADDGSTSDTKDTIEAFSDNNPTMSIRHVWQPDNGFNKNTILNQSIISSSADYLIFIDGDCLACPTFIERHIDLAKKRHFVTGSVIRLNTELTQKLCSSRLTEPHIFTYSWLLAQGQIDRIGTKLKTNLYGKKISTILESLSPVKKVWNGGNTSGWRNDIVEANGFDEDLKYGAEDVELGVRLNNNGVFGRHIRYSAPLLHLDHPRSYVDKAQLRKNKLYLKEVKAIGLKWATNGISKHTQNAN